MFNINTDLTAECIKSLADNNRCITCDKLNTPCVRYPCGHSVCAACVAIAECCLLCITPPPTITHYRDDPLSRRVENASQLVLAYQELFGEDVDKRVSLSKRQKLEKLLFPECIQGSNKYFNKRKSSTSISKGKENNKPNILLPGEEVTSKSLKMENKNSYVQQWLNNVQSPATSKIHRKPFTDLYVSNIQNIATKDKQRSMVTYGKRKHFKTLSNNAENLQTKKFKSVSSFNKDFKQKKSSIMSNLKKCEADESGIGLEDDVIEVLDSQDVIDKDKLACKAVEEAELNKDVCMDLFNDSSYIEQTLPKVSLKSNKSIKTNKVPFYRKSFLHSFECHNCIHEQNNTNFKNISIKIENKSFLTTINISNCAESYKGCVTENKKFSSIDIQEESEKGNVRNRSEALLLADMYDEQDCNNENMNASNIDSNKRNDRCRKGVTISDSSSDSTSCSTGEGKEVLVEVHRSCDERDYAVLSELDLNQSKNRMRPARRGNTPFSTDSSEKENYDPNKMKKNKDGKKCYRKKINTIFPKSKC